MQFRIILQRSCWYLACAGVAVCVLSWGMASFSLVQTSTASSDSEKSEILPLVLSDSEKQWLEETPSPTASWAGRWATIGEGRGVGLREVLVDMNETAMDGWGTVSIHRVVFAGWPWKAFRGKDVWTMSGVPSKPHDMIKSAQRERYFNEPTPYRWKFFEADFRPSPPFQPILGGFLANTAVFAAPIGMVHWCYLSLRARIRRSRKQCERCKYDLRGVPGNICPECGGSK